MGDVDLIRVVRRDLRVRDPELAGRVLRERDRLGAAVVHRGRETRVETVRSRRRVVAEPRELRRSGGDAGRIRGLTPFRDHGCAGNDVELLRLAVPEGVAAPG